jgi:hypothetical protein
MEVIVARSHGNDAITKESIETNHSRIVSIHQLIAPVSEKLQQQPSRQV